MATLVISVNNKKMQSISSQELEEVSKLEGVINQEPTSLEELFSGERKPKADPEAITRYLQAECQKEVKQYLDALNKEHEMCMKERQASVNTSNALTGVMVAWALIGVTMLAKSCINFDKGPKFKV